MTRTIKFQDQTSKLQNDVGRASRNAEASTLVSLRALSARLVDMKTESTGRLTSTAPELDRDLVESEARDALLIELMALFEQHLHPVHHSRHRTRSIAPVWRVPQPPQATSFCASKAARRASNAVAIRS